MYEFVEENYKSILEKIKNVCLKIDRNPSEITLVGISKKQSMEKLRRAEKFGLQHFGENLVQELCEKYSLLPDVVWHFVGHLQTNKVKKIIDKIDYVHSLDSLKLAQVIDREASRENKKIKCFIQVNIGHEKTKSGLEEKTVVNFYEQVRKLKNIEVIGLMCIPPYHENPEDMRGFFRKMKELNNRLSLKELSMGMSHDFPVALEEGATFLRIGEALFGNRPSNSIGYEIDKKRK